MSEKQWKTISLCLNIEGFLKSNRFPDGFDCFQKSDGTPLSAVEALEFLTIEKAKGRHVIPCSAECGAPCKHAEIGCTGFDFSGGGCPGRYKSPSAMTIHPSAVDPTSAAPE